MQRRWEERASALRHTFPIEPSPLPLDEGIRHSLLQVLEKTGGNKSQAARLLGITRQTLRERLERAGGLTGVAAGACSEQPNPSHRTG